MMDHSGNVVSRCLRRLLVQSPVQQCVLSLNTPHVWEITQFIVREHSGILMWTLVIKHDLIVEKKLCTPDLSVQRGTKATIDNCFLCYKAKLSVCLNWLHCFLLYNCALRHKRVTRDTLKQHLNQIALSLLAIPAVLRLYFRQDGDTSVSSICCLYWCVISHFGARLCYLLWWPGQIGAILHWEALSHNSHKD